MCPLHPRSVDLVVEMIQQTISLIGLNNLEFYHIGADEVFNIGSCSKCKVFVKEAGVPALYTKHVRKVLKRLK